MTSNFHFPNTRAPVCSVLVSSEPTAAQAPLPKKVLQSELHEGDLRVESLVANDSQILGKLTATNNIDLKEQVLVYGQTVSLKGSVQAVNSELKTMFKHLAISPYKIPVLRNFFLSRAKWIGRTQLTERLIKSAQMETPT